MRETKARNFNYLGGRVRRGLSQRFYLDGRGGVIVAGPRGRAHRSLLMRLG
jgi:hypothetical protein